jgi:hypothetical protein
MDFLVESELELKSIKAHVFKPNRLLGSPEVLLVKLKKGLLVTTFAAS